MSPSRLVLLVKSMATVFFVHNCRPNLSAQALTLAIALFMSLHRTESCGPSIIREPSSANPIILILPFLNCFRSSSNTRFHMREDNTPPWGQPFSRWRYIFIPSISVKQYLSVR